jgi:hypothetical protein
VAIKKEASKRTMRRRNSLLKNQIQTSGGSEYGLKPAEIVILA